jgi:hypothetical protein
LVYKFGGNSGIGESNEKAIIKNFEFKSVKGIWPFKGVEILAQPDSILILEL